MKTLAALALVLLAASVASGEPRFTFRGIWVDSSSFSTKQAADKMLDRCRRAKINVLLPNVMVHGSLLHKSSHYMHSVLANDEFDPLAYLTEKAHAQGMQVHAWYCVYYDGTDRAKQEWLCTDINGRRMDEGYYLSPQIPGVNDYLLSVMKDGLAYDVDGVHLDYIRYYGTSYDYSDLGRESFIRAHGFDPKDFLDHGDRIVPAEEDPFPVRVLHADRHITRTWEATWTESLMDRSGVGFAFISEKPANVDALRAPGVLVLSNYYDVNAEMAAAIERYVERGGSVVWVDGAVPAGNPSLACLFGVKPGSRWLASEWRTLFPSGDHPLARRIKACSFRSTANVSPNLDGGTVAAGFDTGEPAVIINSLGKGRTALIGFNGAGSVNAGPSQIVRCVLDWLRAESGVSLGRDPMAARREEWISWRANQITDLVRRVHEAVTAKNPKLAVSVAGGFGPNEHSLIFRDGRRWLDEGLLDFANPMDYCDDIRDLRNLLDLHRESVTADELKTFYPGLALYTSKNVKGKKVSASQDAKVVREQLQLVRDKGYRGFTLFCTAQLTEDQIKVIADAAK